MRTIRSKTMAVTAAAVLALAAGAAQAGNDKAYGSKSETSATVGGAAMYPNKTIVDNAVNSPIHTTLVAAVKQAGLVETLQGSGPFTVFAPVNDAFTKLPAGTVDSLMTDAAKPQLTKVLTYHVVPGRITAADLAQRIKAGGGKAKLTTAAGEELTAMMEGGKVALTGMNGSKAYVTQADVMQSNGVIHVVDSVLLPAMA